MDERREKIVHELGGKHRIANRQQLVNSVMFTFVSAYNWIIGRINE